MPNYPRILAEMSRLHWAITPEAMEGLKAAVKSGLKEEDRAKFHQCSEDEYKIVASELGELVEGTKLARIQGDVGSLLIAGPIVPRADAFTEASGLVSIERLTSEFKALADNPAVRRIILVFDCPGGAITGVAEFAALVAGCEKHVTAYVQGMAASAAYWIASAADTIVSSPTGLEGSIGVVQTVNINKPEDEKEFTSTQSPNKRVDASTEKGAAEIIKVLDDLAAVFIDTVAENRGVPVSKVLSDFGKGSVMVASRARTVGMIDKVDTLVNTIKVAEGSDTNVTILATAKKEEKKTMPTLQDMLAQDPTLNVEIEAIKAAARKDGAASEKTKVDTRITGATPYLNSKDYPEVIHAMALDVINGKQELGVLLGTVAVIDTMTAASSTTDAVADSADQPAVAAQSVDPKSTDGVLRSSADIDAEITMLRGEAE